MSGRVGDLSDEQQTALDAIRDRIKDVITPRCDDQYLLRFLRSRKFDLDKTETKLRTTLEFRTKWGSDTILETYNPHPLLEQFFPRGTLGLDKTDHPIVILALGGIDLKGMLKSTSKDEIIRFKVFQMEKLEAHLKALTNEKGKIIESITAIVDMTSLSTYHLWRPGLQLFNEIMQIEEMHYPEIANRVLVVNTPKIFPTIYALVKPFVDPNTREKLEVVGTNWSRIKEFIDEEELLQRYGGKSTNEAPVCFGGRVPKDQLKQNDESLTHTYVKPGKSFTIEIEVTQIGCEVCWEFLTDNHDIGFGLFLKDGDESLEIVPSERITAHLGSVEASLIVEKIGIYILEWDNSFSWTKGKNLRYKYSLVPPKN